MNTVHVRRQGTIGERARRFWRDCVLYRHHRAVYMVRRVQLVVAGMMAAWGLEFLLPTETTRQPAYAAMSLFGLTDMHWALAFMATSALIGAGLAFDRGRCAALGMVWAASLYAFMGVALLLGNPYGTGWIGNGGLAILCLLALRVMHW